MDEKPKSGWVDVALIVLLVVVVTLAILIILGQPGT